ncbi:MAG TPA: hypothetical protein VF131_11035 [Blastocatellia bacterium]|nr:hypothetical protein [Blastocatellia bacterium]
MGLSMFHLKSRLTELERSRRINTSNLADAAFHERNAPPSQRYIYRHRREELAQGLALLQSEIESRRLELQRLETEVGGRWLAIESLTRALRPGGAFDCAIVVARERHLAHPEFACLKSDYEAALRDKENAVALVERLRAEVEALEG